MVDPTRGLGQPSLTASTLLRHAPASFFIIMMLNIFCNGRLRYPVQAWQFCIGTFMIFRCVIVYQ